MQENLDEIKLDDAGAEEEILNSQLNDVQDVSEDADVNDNSLNSAGKQQDEKRQEKANRMVPLKALEEERKKYKAKLAAPEVVKGQKLMDKLTSVFGMDADQILEGIENHESKAETSQADYSVQLAKLVQNPYYADAADYAQELQEYAKDNNCNLKTAYNSLFAEQKYDEIRLKTEQEILNNLNHRQARRIEALTGGSGNGALRKRIKLDKQQLQVAAAYGMTPEEYARYM